MYQAPPASLSAIATLWVDTLYPLAAEIPASDFTYTSADALHSVLGMDLDKSRIIDQAGYMQETENPMLIDFLISLLKVLGEPQRMKILRILASNRDQKLCVTDIARILHLTQPAVTKHIKIMKKTGFITSVREGKRVYYQVDLPMLEYYKKVFEATYPKGFYPCPYNLQCDQCPERETCA